MTKAKLKSLAQKRLSILLSAKEELQEKTRPLLSEQVAEKYKTLYALIDELITMDAKILIEGGD